MAKITELVKAGSVRVNLGNFAHADYFASVKKELSVSDDPIAEAQDASACVCEMLLNDLRDHYKARGKKMTDTQIRRMYGLQAEFD